MQQRRMYVNIATATLASSSGARYSFINSDSKHMPGVQVTIQQVVQN
jgi:hypothetical protein